MSLIEGRGNFDLASNSQAGLRDQRNLNEMQRTEIRKQERLSLIELIDSWLTYMASPDCSPLRERMALFWHGHFACTSRLSGLAARQINTIREHALGNFRDLLIGIAKDASMIRFLNNQQNRKEQPNENFARELMELFTLGRGHYTEQDIKEAARAFTGWSSDFGGYFIFRPRWHDYGVKTFFGQDGNFDGTDIIDLILENRQTARFITEKIYRYFVSEIVNEGIVEDLSNQFYESGYQIDQLMRSIFESDWFYDPENRGTKFKSPVELMVGLTQTLSLQITQA